MGHIVFPRILGAVLNLLFTKVDCPFHGQVSVNKRISVLSKYFDVSFEIYYVRLKYIDSIGQVVKLFDLKTRHRLLYL